MASPRLLAAPIAAVGGLLSVPDDSSAMSFAGIKGMRNLLGNDVADSIIREAEEKLSSGLPKEEVFRDLGVFKGPDSQWRYEISDQPAFYRGSKAAESSYANDVYMHPELYRAYPGLENVLVRERGGEYPTGSFDSGTFRMTLGGPNKAESAAHEMQHGIQEVEGFARGGTMLTPDTGSKESYAALADAIKPVHDWWYSLPSSEARAIKRAYKEEYGEPMPTPLQFISPGDAADRFALVEGILPDNVRPNFDIRKASEAIDDANFMHYGSESDAYNRYMNLAGEAEARAVQNRLGMSMDERRSNFPEYATRNDLIVKYGIPAAFAGGLLSSADDAEAALPQRWYHGSRVKDIDVLQHTNTPSNKRTGYNYGRGVYGSSEPVGTVDAYSDWDKGAVYGFNTPPGVLDMTEMGDADRSALKNIIAKRGKYLDPNVVDQYSDKPLLDRLIHEFGPGNISDVIREAGYNGHAFTYGGMPGEKWGVFYEPQKAEKIRSLIPAGMLSGAAIASPEDVWASYNEPPRDAIEESWNPFEALAGGLGGGVASAFAGVPMDLAATIGMDKLGGLLSAPGGDATDYGNIRSWR